MKLNIKKLAGEISAESGMTVKQVSLVLDGIFVLIAEQIEQGHEVDIPGFGKFRRKESAARKGRNPATGEEIEIAAKKAPAFLPAKSFKEQVNDGS